MCRAGTSRNGNPTLFESRAEQSRGKEEYPCGNAFADFGVFGGHGLHLGIHDFQPLLGEEHVFLHIATATAIARPSFVRSTTPFHFTITISTFYRH